MSPIHTSLCAACACGKGMDRRQFVSAATLATVSAMLAACGVEDSTSPLLVGTGTVNVLNQPTLNEISGVALVTVLGAPLAIVRANQTTFLALSRRCPHQGTTVNLEAGGNGFICPNHGARFNLTGQWIGGQPTTSLISYPTSFDASTGVLTVTST